MPDLENLMINFMAAIKLHSYSICFILMEDKPLTPMVTRKIDTYYDIQYF